LGHGPYPALVATDRGLYVAESGWLIQPAWRDALPAEGLKATALADNGVAWIAHEKGLFRIEDGALSELKDSAVTMTSRMNTTKRSARRFLEW
jgi:ligand-binding sensor domain-containing protein